MTAVYRLRANNTATSSENAIHHDDVAQVYGFRGGLVPGVDVFAYLTQPVVSRWGLEWLERGTIDARFIQPVYDGDDVSVEMDVDGDRLALAVRDSKAGVCATAVASMDGTVEGAPPPVPAGAQVTPDDRPPASPSTLAPGTFLSAPAAHFRADRAAEYLDDISEALDVYRAEGVAHPGWLLRFSNRVLSSTVRLGPWMHVQSDVHHAAAVRDGDQVEACGVVLDEFERKGHRFVVADVWLTVDGAPVQRVTHTAIYQPRRADRPQG